MPIVVGPVGNECANDANTLTANGQVRRLLDNHTGDALDVARTALLRG